MQVPEGGVYGPGYSGSAGSGGYSSSVYAPFGS